MYILNEPKSRIETSPYLDLTKFFAIFTEIDPISEKKN